MKLKTHFIKSWVKARENRPWFERHPLVSVSIMIASLTIAGVSHLMTNWKPPVQAESTVTYTDNTQAFINQIAGSAQSIAQSNDLYASVMIAQAVHESASGTSALGIPPYHNLFGIKGTYNGNSVTMKTWEDDGNGNAYYIDDAFRAYPSWADSLADYAMVLSSSYYNGVHKSVAGNYQNATAALTGTYATDTSYNSKLNRIISKYNLTQYDQTLKVSGDSSLVWNPYRGAYTTNDVLSVDEAYAKANNLSATYSEPTSGYSSNDTSNSAEYVWNQYRGSYTDRDTLNADTAWANR